MNEAQQQRAKKNYSVLLNKLASVGQNTVASALNVDEATISRMKADGRLELFAKLLAAIGVKTIGEELICVKRDELENTLFWARKGMSTLRNAEDLQWDGEVE